MKTKKTTLISIMLVLLFITACAEKGNNWGPDGPPKVFEPENFKGKNIALLKGTMLDQIISENIPGSKPVYFNNDTDGVNALINRKVDAFIADDAIVKLFVARTPGLRMLEPYVTYDNYGIAVAKENVELKQKLNDFINILKSDGTLNDMEERWLNTATPTPMPEIPEGQNGVINFGTSGVTDGFSFYQNGEVTGFDVEFAKRFANYLDQKLVITMMDFGDMIPSVVSGKADFAASCITITEERKKSVGFSDTYYTGGTAIAVYEKP